MGTSDNYCLRWNDFESNSTLNLKYRFRESSDDSEFYDVTLCCDNGTDIVPAHRKILSACSPLFRKILSRQKNQQNSFLYLKGIHLKEIKAILDFIYHGEVNVSQESLTDFLAVAEELSVKGLTNNSEPVDSDTVAKKAAEKKLKRSQQKRSQEDIERNQPPGSIAYLAKQAAKKLKPSQSSDPSEGIDIKPIKAEPEPLESGAYYGDESYGAGRADEEFDQYGEGNEFGEFMDAAGGSGVGLDGKKIDLKRTKFTIDFKLERIEEAKRTSNGAVGRTYGIEPSVISRWRQIEAKLRRSLAEGSKYRLIGGGKKRDDLLDQLLYEWYSQHIISSNAKVTGSMLRAKARELANGCATGSEYSKFSHGWLEGFKKKYGIRISPNKGSNKDHGEANNKLMEKILYDWLIHQQKNHATVSGHMVRAKAEELSKGVSPDSDYKFTTGWLDGFKKRFNVRLSDKYSSAQPSQPSTSSDQLDLKPFESLYLPHRL